MGKRSSSWRNESFREIEDAIATFRALVEVRPGEARNIGCLGTILLGHQQREEGLKTLDQAIAAARADKRVESGE